MANEICSQGRVQINGRIAKPGNTVKEGDIITIRFGDRIRQYEILAVNEHANKSDAQEMYREI